MATLEELKNKERIAHERVVARQKQLAKKERKARAHALITVGGMVVQYAPGKDWKRLDWDRLAKWLSQNSNKIEEFEAPALDTDAAYKRCREWETAVKNQTPQPRNKYINSDDETFAPQNG